MAYLIINHANGLQWGQKVATIWKIFLSKIVQDFRHRILENMLWNLYENVHVKFFWPQSVEIFFVLFFRVRSKPPPQIPHDQDSTQIVEYFVYIVLLVRAHINQSNSMWNLKVSWELPIFRRSLVVRIAQIVEPNYLCFKDKKWHVKLKSWLKATKNL